MAKLRSGKIKAGINGFAPCGRVGIIFHVNFLNTGSLLYHLTNGQMAERQIVGILHISVGVVGNAGRCNADGIHIADFYICLTAKRQAKGGYIRNDFLCRAFRAGRYAHFFQYLIIFVYKAGGNVGSAEIHSDTIHIFLLYLYLYLINFIS